MKSADVSSIICQALPDHAGYQGLTLVHLSVQLDTCFVGCAGRRHYVIMSVKETAQVELNSGRV